MNLLQLVLVIVIVGVLVGAFALPMVSGIDLWEFIQTRQELLAEANYGLERMVREMACVRDDQSITAATIGTFGFFSSATNESVTFTLSLAATALQRNTLSLIGGDAASGAVSVTALVFTYYGMWNNVLPLIGLTASPTPIWRVRIDLTVRAPNGQTLTLQEEVFPRALQREKKGGMVIW